MQRILLRLKKIFSTASGSLLDPNSVLMIDCLMSDSEKETVHHLFLFLSVVIKADMSFAPSNKQKILFHIGHLADDFMQSHLQ